MHLYPSLIVGFQVKVEDPLFSDPCLNASFMTIAMLDDMLSSASPLDLVSTAYGLNHDVVGHRN